MFHIYNVHLLDNGGRVWIRGAWARSPDEALTVLQRLGEYEPVRYRVVLIQRVLKSVPRID